MGPSTDNGAMRNTTASAERIGRYRRGRLSEWLAAAALLAKGYRILGRRVRTPYGEIDLIALRGRRLAFVEVKRRHEQGLDAVLVMPRRLPVHVPNALQAMPARQHPWR